MFGGMEWSVMAIVDDEEEEAAHEINKRQLFNIQSTTNFHFCFGVFGSVFLGWIFFTHFMWIL